MAGYNRGIVATRKLNENNKAGLGRRGDTKIREVDNRESHVSALEAYLIDVNGKAGEEYAKRVGAGTVNPLTGMPEYHDEIKDGQYVSHDHEDSGAITYHGAQSYEVLSDIGTVESGGSGYFLGGEQLKEFGLDYSDVKYFDQIFTDEPFGFLEDERTTREKEIGIGERGLASTRDLTLKGIGIGERGLASTRDLTLEGLTGQQQALGRTTGRGLSGAKDVRATNIRKSNLARSGTITEGYEKQKKELLQDYTAGTQEIGRQRRGALADYGFGMEGYGVERESAAADYGFGMEDFGIDRERMQTTYDKGTYFEEQRQLDEYWDMIAIRQGVG